MSIGSNIKRYRKIKGLTQEQLANKIGMSKVAIQKYETEKREPKNIIVSDIAKALNVSVVDLYKEDVESIEDIVQAKEIEQIDVNTDLAKIIRNYRDKSGISYTRLADKIGVSKKTIEDIVYGIRPGKDSTREKIYNYIVTNDYRNRIVNLYSKERRDDIKRIVAIHKTVHRLLGLLYVVELIDKKDNVLYEVLLEREVI